MKASNYYKKPNDFYSLNKNNNDEKKCTFKFSQCDDNKYQLFKLSKEELKAFISFAKRAESLSWQEIKSYQGFKYENLPELDGPDSIDRDITLTSMRVSKKFRLIGYRQESNYYIVWFDKDHETC